MKKVFIVIGSEKDHYNIEWISKVFIKRENAEKFAKWIAEQKTDCKYIVKEEETSDWFAEIICKDN